MAHRSLPHWHPPATLPVPGSSQRLAFTFDPANQATANQATANLATPSRATPVMLHHRVTGVSIGQIDIGQVDLPTHAAAVACTIHPDHRRQGLATEALRDVVTTLLRPQKDGGWGLRRVSATVAASNTAAKGVAHGLGVRREQRRRQDRWVDDVGLDDTLGWAVLADEWDLDARRPRGADPVADVGVGPHPEPWPTDEHLDPTLLRDGDRRNVADRYRYWTVPAIAADLVAVSHPFHIAIENWRHDLNIGTVVRNANAFGARAVHVIGRRQWNRRGAMVTDRYLDVRHHPDLATFAEWAVADGLVVVGIDNLPGSTSIVTTAMPRDAVLLFGQEGPGLSPQARDAAEMVLHIPQTGSTRSINAGVASGIAMALWVQQHGTAGHDGRPPAQ